MATWPKGRAKRYSGELFVPMVGVVLVLPADIITATGQLMDTGNLYHSHKECKMQKYIRPTALIPKG